MSPTHVNIIHKFYQYYQDYQHGLSRYTRVYKKVKDYVEAVGAGSAVKKDDCSQLKLPELGKQEAGATSHFLIILPYCLSKSIMTNWLSHTA